MTRIIFLILFALTVTSCNQGLAPTNPEMGDDSPSAFTPLPVSYDPLDDFFREGAGIIEGDVTLNGATETDPSYDTSPYVVTQAAKNGDIAIYRIRGRLTNNGTTSLYTKQSSPSKNYSSFSVPGTNVDQYKAMYVTNTEPLHLTFFNSNSYNTPLNSKAAIYDYNYKTTPADNAGEPNDDENPATITDRTLANNLPQGFVATRSVYSFDPTKKDLEEWYKVTVNEGDRFSFKFTTVRDRFGTWGYTMKVFDPAGVQMGGTTNISINEGAAGITRTATQSGTHFLQLVGTPATKNNTNVFFNLYTITACLAPKITTIALTPGSTCPGASTSWFSSVSAGTNTFSWDFGGGCIPNTSSAQVPFVTLGAAGNYTARLTLTNGCSLATLDVPYTVGCNGWAGTQGGAGAIVDAADIVVSPNGTSRIIGTFTGTADLNPGPLVFNRTAAGQAMFLTVLNDQGEAQLLDTYGGAASTSIDPLALAFDPTAGYRITGQYTGTVDFDPFGGVTNRTSTVDGEVFLLSLDVLGNLKWVNTFAADGEGETVVLLPAIDKTVVMGTFAGSVDFDPGASAFIKSAGTGKDAFCMLYENATGHFTNGVTWGNTNQMFVDDASTNGSVLDIVGQFTGTLDIDPGAGITNLTPGSSSTGYYTQLAVSTALTFDRAGAIGGTGFVNGGGVVTLPDTSLRMIGTFVNTADFDPGGDTQFRTSIGAGDAYVLAINADNKFDWVYTVGGTGSDGSNAIVLASSAGEVRVVGDWTGTVDFDPGVGQDLRTATGSIDSFLLGISSTGARLFASTWSSQTVVLSMSVGVDGTGAAYTCGKFSAQTDFDPSAGTFLVSPAGIQDGFVEKILANGTWIP